LENVGTTHFLNFGGHLQLEQIRSLGLLLRNNTIDFGLGLFRLNRITNRNADRILRQVLNENTLRIGNKLGSGPWTLSFPNHLDKASRRSAETRLAETSRHELTSRDDHDVILQQTFDIIRRIAHCLGEGNILGHNT
jgi:hypothetical protein